MLFCWLECGERLFMSLYFTCENWSRSNDTAASSQERPLTERVCFSYDSRRTCVADEYRAVDLEADVLLELWGPSEGRPPQHWDWRKHLLYSLRTYEDCKTNLFTTKKKVCDCERFIDLYTVCIYIYLGMLWNSAKRAFYKDAATLKTLTAFRIKRKDVTHTLTCAFKLFLHACSWITAGPRRQTLYPISRRLIGRLKLKGLRFH